MKNSNKTDTNLPWQWKLCFNDMNKHWVLTLESKDQWFCSMSYKKIPYDPKKIAERRFRTVKEAMINLPQMDFDS